MKHIPFGDGASDGPTRFTRHLPPIICRFNPGPLTQDEETIIDVVREIGRKEALHRLLLCGRYAALWNAIKGRKGGGE